MVEAHTEQHLAPQEVAFAHFSFRQVREQCLHEAAPDCYHQNNLTRFQKHSGPERSVNNAKVTEAESR
jgi:hypothetical protein